MYEKRLATSDVFANASCQAGAKHKPQSNAPVLDKHSFNLGSNETL